MGTASVSLVMAKSCVAPLKAVTIPRLELQAAVEAVRLAVFIRTEMKLHIDEEYFWSDSTTTLGYIKNSDSQFYMFTANRVNEIRQYSNPNQWYHIAGSENPADIVSRGASAAQLAAGDWYRGPKFLRKLVITKLQGQNHDFSESLVNDPEVKKPKTTLATETNAEAFIVKITKKFSS
jgi:hypothetical protein